MTAQNALIYIVEDDGDVRASLQIALEACGYKVRAHASAEALLAGDMPRDVDCVVSDYNLPGMSGLDMIEKLRSSGSKSPAIVISANAKTFLARAARANVVAVLRKPAAYDALTQWLELIYGPQHAH